ncbi:hypothetical protein B0H17DRAFT_1186208 [Mycena rosella]|uniref:Secreted protein n=1 Tax=Mycena rosella TaxID=1033263 RepID=A0AAD7CN79_MYCRO|nr:hypothetical protein B0H17DRAFT_1186208 [Mycena rosella]
MGTMRMVAIALTGMRIASACVCRATRIRVRVHVRRKYLSQRGATDPCTNSNGPIMLQPMNSILTMRRASGLLTKCHATDVPAHNRLTGARRKPLGSNSWAFISLFPFAQTLRWARSPRDSRTSRNSVRGWTSTIRVDVSNPELDRGCRPLIAVVLVQGEQKIGGFITLMFYEHGAGKHVTDTK